MAGKNISNKHWMGVLLFIEAASLISIFLSFFLNPTIVSHLLNKDGGFSDPTKLFIYRIEIIFFIVGVVMLLIKRMCLNNCSYKIKNMTINIILFFISLMVILGLLEVSIRIFAPQKTLDELISSSPAIFEEGKFFSWQLKPNSTGRRCTGESNVSYSINSMGMRDIERNLTKNKSMTRILFLGDSFTEGFGVEQNKTYAFLLEKILQKKGYNVEVFNGGVEGYSPDTEYAYLEEKIDKIKPDVVLLGFYAGNDIRDISGNLWEETNNGLPIKIVSKIAEVKDNKLILKQDDMNHYLAKFDTYVEIIMMKYSHLYIFIKKRAGGSDNSYFDVTPFLAEDPINKQKGSWERTLLVLDGMKDLSKSKNASFQLIIIPARLQVDDKEWAYAEKKFRKYEPIRNLTQDRIIQWCLKNDVNCIDLLPWFLDSEEELYYKLTDTHLNELGNLRTAQIISEKISEIWL